MLCLCIFKKEKTNNIHLLLLLVAPSLLTCVACTSVDQLDCVKATTASFANYRLSGLAGLPVWRHCSQSWTEKPKLGS